MLNQLSFKGQWRQYQRRVLDKAESFMDDGKIHLVAAPGSGKTTLGIEFIQRFGNPTLILVPTVTIRQQWVDRIKQAFLSDDNLDRKSTRLNSSHSRASRMPSSA